MKKSSRRLLLLVAVNIVSIIFLFGALGTLFLQSHYGQDGGVFGGNIRVASCRPAAGILPAQICTGSYARGGGGMCWLDSRSVYTFASPKRNDYVSTYNPVSRCTTDVWVPSLLIDLNLAKSIAATTAVIGGIGFVFSMIFLIRQSKSKTLN